LAGTLRAGDRGLAQVVSRWEQLLRFAALRLSRELGAEVQVVTSRKEGSDPGVLLAAQAQSLLTTGTLTGALKIPDAVGPLDLVVDLRVGRVTVYVDVDAPRQGRQATRVSWLVRQLKDAPDGLRIDAHAVGSHSTTSELLRVLREHPEALIEDPKRDLRTFRITASSPLGMKRGTGRGGFIDSVLAAIDGFYGAVVQHVRPWTTHAPQLPKDGKTAAEAAGLDLAPPPGDLLEDISPEVVAQPDAPLPEGLTIAVEAAAGAVFEDGGAASPNAGARQGQAGQGDAEASPDEDRPLESSADSWDGEAKVLVEADTELVSWDMAQDRLEQERSLDEVDSSPSS
ncbi:MAG TPA: hypothetical protein VNG12_07505, partial [Acidimicrobiales bacterium]|nr:hypothetical protein [Acidimicrobiales bacterium]